MTVLRLYGLEWHDAWLASIIDGDDGKSYAAFAVAIDWNNHRSRFVICQISPAQAALIACRHKNSGFGLELSEAWRDALSCGPAYLIDEEPREGGSFSLVESNAEEREHFEAYSLPLVELASTEEAHRRWLHNA